MKLLVLTILLAASAGREIINETQEIAPGDWGFRTIPFLQEPARISVSYEVLNGSGKVRAALMVPEDMSRMNSDLPGAIVQTEEGRSGFFVDTLRRRGNYVVVLDNQGGNEPASVRLQVVVDYSAAKGTDVKQLPASRQLAVVLISFAVFFGIVGVSAKKLLGAIRR